MDKKIIIILVLLQSLLGGNTLGDYYAQKNYYFEAITEYKRQLFEKKYSQEDKVLYKIALLYYRSGKKKEAEDFLLQAIFNGKQTDFDINAYILLAKTHWDNYDYKTFRTTINQLQYRVDQEAQKKLEYIKAWSYFYNAEWEQGTSIIDSLDLNYDDQLLEDVAGVEEVPQKSSNLAGLMSIIIPGSGQFYIGDYKNGLFSFLLVGSIGGSIVWNVLQKAYFVALSKYIFLFQRYYRGGLRNLAHRVEKDNISKIGDYLKDIVTNYPDPVEELESIKPVSDTQIFD